jgi:hypothetical protein
VLVADTGAHERRRLCGAGKLQRDIAWFNPAHEDNYYIAAAILPWNGQVDAAQYVCARHPMRAPLTGIRCFTTVSLLSFSQGSGDRCAVAAQGRSAGQESAGRVGIAECRRGVDREGLPDRQRCRIGRGDGGETRRAALFATTCRSGPAAA